MRKRKVAAWALIGAVLGGGASAAGVVAATGARPLPAAKQRVLDQQAAARANAPARAHPNLSPPPASTLPARVAGIVSTGVNEGPFPPGEFTVRNVWNGPFSGAWYLVYAGEARDPGTGDELGGGVRIYSLPLDPNASDQTPAFVGAFAAPAATGALTITAVTGKVLTLASESGGTLSFDLATDAFG